MRCVFKYAINDCVVDCYVAGTSLIVDIQDTLVGDTAHTITVPVAYLRTAIMVRPRTNCHRLVP